MSELNLRHSIFEGFNDKHGILVCGLEYGMGKEEREADPAVKKIVAPIPDVECTYSNLSPRYGDNALKERFHSRIIKWFRLWGHPLTRNLPDKATDFDRCIAHANWCGTQDYKFSGYNKAAIPEHVNHFILHVEKLRPRLIIFVGVQLIYVLQTDEIMRRFQSSSEGGMGSIIPVNGNNLQILKKDFVGKRFRVGFQSFENGEVVALPHTASIGLSDQYIEQFKPEMSERILKIKQQKGIVD